MSHGLFVSVMLVLAHSQEVTILFDPLDSTTASLWTFDPDATNVEIPSTASQCSPKAECFGLLRSGAWVGRTFDVSGFKDVWIQFVSDGDGGTIWIEAWNNDILLTDVTRSFSIVEDTETVHPSPSSKWDDLANLTIHFEQNANDALYIDSLYIFGVPITSSPTGS